MKSTLYIRFLTSIGATCTVWYALETILSWSVTAEKFSKSMTCFRFFLVYFHGILTHIWLGITRMDIPISICNKNCFWQFTDTLISMVKLIGQWIPDGGGRGIIQDILNNHIHYQHSTKKCMQIWDNLQNLTLSSFLLLKIIPTLYQFFLEC